MKLATVSSCGKHIVGEWGNMPATLAQDRDDAQAMTGVWEARKEE